MAQQRLLAKRLAGVLGGVTGFCGVATLAQQWRQLQVVFSPRPSLVLSWGQSALGLLDTYPSVSHVITIDSFHPQVSDIPDPTNLVSI